MYERIARDGQAERESRLKEQAVKERQRVLVGIISANLKTLCDEWIPDEGKRTATYNALNSLLLCAVELVAGWKVRAK